MRAKKIITERSINESDVIIRQRPSLRKRQGITLANAAWIVGVAALAVVCFAMATGKEVWA